MPETTHTLKFRADSRAVKVLGQDIQKAFDPRSPRAFRRELGGLQRRLKDVTSAQVTLVKELQRTEEGTDAYKKLAEQLGAVEDQAKTVKSAISGITSAFKDFNAEKRRGFGAGLAQGMGVAQYIPSEAGMGRRIAGGVIGRGIRRGAGAAAAPLQQPGLGGLTTMLGAIPIVGQMAAGAMQALSGMYQEAVAFHQSRVENLSYLQGGAIDNSARARGAGVTASTAFRLGATGKAFRKGKVSAAARGIAREELESAVFRPKVIGGRIVTGGPAAAESSYTRKTRQAIKILDEEERQALATKGNRVRMVKGTAVAIAADAEKTPEEKAKIRKYYAKLRSGVFDKVANNIVKDVATESQKAGRKERARRFSSAFWRESVRLPGAGFGARFGFRGAETQAQLSGFMGARGGSYTRLGRRQFVQALAARRVYGVQAQTAGAFARMGEEGGGGAGAADLARTLQISFEMGLRGSLIPEYLQTLVGLGQQAEKQGVKFDTREFQRSGVLMNSLGFKGPQIGRITGALNTSAMGLSQRGVSSPVDMLMMRAAGFDPTAGPESYMRASNKLAGGMDMETMSNLMRLVTTGAGQGMGSRSREGAVFMLRRVMGRMNAPIGPGQASKMIDAHLEGKLGREHLTAINTVMDREERKDAHGRLVTGAKVGVGMVAGLTQTEASLESRRIALGTRMAGTMASLNTATINAASAVSNFRGELNTVAKWMAGLTGKLSEVTEGGAAGTWVAIKQALGAI
jgi:hypothetical protein